MHCRFVFILYACPENYSIKNKEILKASHDIVMQRRQQDLLKTNRSVQQSKTDEPASPYLY